VFYNYIFYVASKNDISGCKRLIIISEVRSMTLRYYMSQTDFPCGVKIQRTAKENIIYTFKDMKCVERTCQMLREIEIS
jgi:hypothetical protein